MIRFIQKPEKLFLILGLFLGSLLIFVNPPFQAPDEDAHLFKMWGITEGSFNFKVLDGKKGHVIPKELIELAKMQHPVKHNVFLKLNIQDYSKFNKPINIKNQEMYITPPTGYTIFSYIPTVFVLMILKYIKMTPLTMIYILRFCCLLTYLAIIYNAIKITPYRKWLFSIAGLIPTNLYIAASINTDCLVISTAFLLIAYTLQLKFDKNIEQITKKQILIWAGLLTFLCILKYMYYPFILLYLLIPKEKFNIIKNYYKIFAYISLFVLIYITSFVLLVIYMHSLQHIQEIPSTTLGTIKSISSIKENLGELLFSIVITPILNLKQTISQAITNFGWGAFGIKSKFIYIFVGLIFSSMFYNYKKEYIINSKDKIILLSIIFLCWFLLILSIITVHNIIPVLIELKKYTNSYYLYILYGWQGRYGGPYIPLVFMLFANNKIFFQNKLFPTIFVSTITLIYIICYIVIFTRFY